MLFNATWIRNVAAPPPPAAPRNRDCGPTHHFIVRTPAVMRRFEKHSSQRVPLPEGGEGGGF